MRGMRLGPRVALQVLCTFVLVACAPAPEVYLPELPPEFDANRAAKNFVTVIAEVEPVAEQVCRERLPRGDCDFQIVVDDRPNQPSNAYQTVDRNGRPVIAFTLALIAEARNRDELAFILGHEASHHIAGHLPKTQNSALAGAYVLGTLAQLGGSSPATVETATRLGAAVGARRFSQDFELEADALGTVIAKRAGYDPVLGAQFFTRIPDPGDTFLGSHPPNAARLAKVREVAAAL
ncbi:M48 family metallopeptidase [Alphaproteobacteria bacterium KMM 3653]|uniref:M48 family metallopeptidase n=2 Tax=Harenicola maris TaxID=2841044 RepID=A0AAP2CVQ4_9RHOB|nr:M48 family metallopeptidase [Harenicola maris]